METLFFEKTNNFTGSYPRGDCAFHQDERFEPIPSLLAAPGAALQLPTPSTSGYFTISCKKPKREPTELETRGLDVHQRQLLPNPTSLSTASYLSPVARQLRQKAPSEAQLEKQARETKIPKIFFSSSPCLPIHQAKPTRAPPTLQHLVDSFLTS